LSEVVSGFSVKSDLTQKLAEKTITKQELFKKVEQDFGLLPQVLEGVSSSKAAIRC